MRLTAEMTLKRGDYNCFRNSFCGMEFFPEHKHCFFEFFLVISGVLLHRLNGVDYRLNPGSIQLLQPGDAHALRSADPGGQVEIYNVNVASHEFLKNLYFVSPSKGNILLDGVQIISGVPDYEWRSLISKAETLAVHQHEVHHSAELRCSLCRLLTQEVIYLLLRRNARETHPVVPWLENAMREMEKRENYLNGFPRFVELSGRSPEHLCLTMRLYYGKSPQQWIIELRLQNAAVLLEHSSMNVSGIAHASGFCNLSYFRRCFQRQYGIAPLAYRRKLHDCD